MTFDWLTLGFQIVNVAVLLVILRHFLFRPLAQIIATRKAGIEEAMDKATAAGTEADKATAAAKAEQAKAEALRQGVLDKARDEAEVQAKEVLDKAHKQAVQILADAHTEATQVAQRGERDMLAHVRDLAETIAHKALSTLPEPPNVAGFAARLAQALAAMPQDQRKGLLDGGNLRLVSAQKLSAEDLEAARAALRPLGIADPAVVVDAALLAGLDLRSDTGVLQNSVAHDLSRISKAMADDD